jgi:hypothetical protein
MQASSPASLPGDKAAPEPVVCLAGGVAFAASPPDARNAYHPSLTVLSDREWFASFDLGTSTETLDYHTRGLRTLDGGATWKDEGPLLVKPEGAPTTHTLRTRRLEGQRLLGFGKWENRQGYEAHRSNRETLGQVPMKLFWFESLDGGRKWSAPHWIEPPLVGPTWELCHAIIRLPDGSWAAPVATWRGWNGELPNGELTGMLVSSDAGATWPRFAMTFDGRKSGCIHWEQCVIVRRDQSLVATAWVYDPKTRETRPSAYVVSSDGGKTFSPPMPTGFHAQTCKIVELDSGRLLAAYRRHDRPGLWVEVASVDAGGWRTERRGLLWGGAESGMAGRASASEELNALRFGFPTLASLANGDVLIVFWGTHGKQTAIHWRRFRPDAIPAFAGA